MKWSAAIGGGTALAALLILLPCPSLPAAERRKPAPAQKPAPTPAPAVPAIPAAPSGPDDATRTEAQRLHDRALKDFEAGNLAAAKAGFQKVLNLSPGNAPALINLALIEQREHRYEDAERHLREILHNDPASASAWLLLGIGAYEQGQLEAAHAHLAEAVLYAPKDAKAHLFLGVVLGRKGWYSAGEEELRRAVELDPRSRDAHYNLAVLYLERVPPAVELARRHYQRSLELGGQPDPEIEKKLSAAPPPADPPH